MPLGVCVYGVPPQIIQNRLITRLTATSSQKRGWPPASRSQRARRISSGACAGARRPRVDERRVRRVDLEPYGARPVGAERATARRSASCSGSRRGRRRRRTARPRPRGRAPPARAPACRRREMYGGFDTTTSTRAVDSAACSATPRRTASYRAPRPSAAAFSRASSTAAALTSTPTQRAAGSARSSARPMAPLPQPTSRKVAARSAPPAPCASSRRARRASSVSGRGISTGGRDRQRERVKVPVAEDVLHRHALEAARAHLGERTRASSSSGEFSWDASAARDVPKPAARVSRCSADSEASGTSRASNAAVAACSAPPSVDSRGGANGAAQAARRRVRRLGVRRGCAARSTIDAARTRPSRTALDRRRCEQPQNMSIGRLLRALLAALRALVDATLGDSPPPPQRRVRSRLSVAFGDGASQPAPPPPEVAEQNPPLRQRAEEGARNF